MLVHLTLLDDLLVDLRFVLGTIILLFLGLLLLLIEAGKVEI